MLSFSHIRFRRSSHAQKRPNILPRAGASQMRNLFFCATLACLIGAVAADEESDPLSRKVEHGDKAVSATLSNMRSFGFSFGASVVCSASSTHPPNASTARPHTTSAVGIRQTGWPLTYDCCLLTPLAPHVRRPNSPLWPVHSSCALGWMHVVTHSVPGTWSTLHEWWIRASRRWIISSK